MGTNLRLVALLLVRVSQPAELTLAALTQRHKCAGSVTMVILQAAAMMLKLGVIAVKQSEQLPTMLMHGL
jgi:hypothetical protein